MNGRRIPVRCLAPGEPSPADLLLVAVKQHHLADAIEDVRGVVADGTLILSLLNGISSEAVLGAAFGSEKVLPAFVVGNDVVREGTRTRYTRLGKLVFGATTNDPADPRVVAVRGLLERARIPCAVPADILGEQWWKFMLNVGVNQVSAVLRAPYRAFALPEVQDLVRRAALEVVAVSRHEGVRLGPEDVERIFPILATLGPDGKTSMLQDVEAGRKTEVEISPGPWPRSAAGTGWPPPSTSCSARSSSRRSGWPAPPDRRRRPAGPGRKAGGRAAGPLIARGEPRQLALEQLGAERLAEGAVGVHRGRLVEVPARDDHLAVLVAGVRAEPLQERAPVHAGHGQVEQDHVGVQPCLEQLHRVPAVRRLGDLVIAGLEPVRDELPAARARPRPPARARDSRRAARGRTTRRSSGCQRGSALHR